MSEWSMWIMSWTQRKTSDFQTDELVAATFYLHHIDPQQLLWSCSVTSSSDCAGTGQFSGWSCKKREHSHWKQSPTQLQRRERQLANQILTCKWCGQCMSDTAGVRDKRLWASLYLHFCLHHCSHKLICISELKLNIQPCPPETMFICCDNYEIWAWRFLACLIKSHNMLTHHVLYLFLLLLVSTVAPRYKAQTNMKAQTKGKRTANHKSYIIVWFLLVLSYLYMVCL